VTDAIGAPEPADVESLPYDEAFAELQRTVTALETGGQSLEATIALYERAVALQRRCERLLGEAELRVQQLLARPGGTLAAVDVVPEEAEEA
jgi:exodeoxyribonuclease VII small subunit